MQNVAATRIVPATQAKLWSLLANVTTVDDWHPDVASVELLTPQSTGIGAARRCFFHDGTSVREEIVELDEGERVRLRLSEFDMPMKRMEAEFSLAPSTDTETAVTFTVYYEMKMGIFGSLLGATVVRRRLAQMAGGVLDGLAPHPGYGPEAMPAARVTHCNRQHRNSSTSRQRYASIASAPHAVPRARYATKAMATRSALGDLRHSFTRLS